MFIIGQKTARKLQTLPDLPFDRRIAFWTIPSWPASYTITCLLIAAHCANLIKLILTEKHVCCDKSTLAQGICGQHINSLSVKIPWVTLFLTSKHWTAWATFRLLKLYVHKKSFRGSGIKLLSFLFHSSFCPFLSPPSVWLCKECILSFGAKFLLKKWWTIYFQCDVYLSVLYFFFFLINNAAVVRFWSFKLRTFRHNLNV